MAKKRCKTRQNKPIKCSTQRKLRAVGKREVKKRCREPGGGKFTPCGTPVPRRGVLPSMLGGFGGPIPPGFNPEELPPAAPSGVLGSLFSAPGYPRGMPDRW